MAGSPSPRYEPNVLPRSAAAKVSRVSTDMACQPANHHVDPNSKSVTSKRSRSRYVSRRVTIL